MSTISSEASGTATEAEFQVVEFELGGEFYCVRIEFVEQIVKRGNLTAVPNTPSHVRGVMDLRSETTRIVDPKLLLNVDVGEEDASRILVFDGRHCDLDEQVGWLVDDVHHVRRVDADALDSSGVLDRDGIDGVIHRNQDEDRGFTICVDPFAFF